MSEKSEAFKKEIQELMAKYGAAFGEADHYDGQEKYVGSTPYVIVDGEQFEMADFEPKASA